MATSVLCYYYDKAIKITVNNDKQLQMIWFVTVQSVPFHSLNLLTSVFMVTNNYSSRMIPMQTQNTSRLVAVAFWLVWSLNLDTNVISLVGGQLGQFNTQCTQVQRGDLLVQVLW